MRHHGEDDDAGAQRLALCEALPDALTAETGDAWTIADGGRSWGTVDGAPGRPGYFRGVALERADGLRLHVAQVQPWESRLKARPVFPPDPVTGKGRTMRDAGFPFWNEATPTAGFAPSRPAAQVAREIARKVLTPRVGEALAAMREADARTAADATQAETWRARVGEAHGQAPRVSDNGSGPRVYWHRGETCAYRLESSHDRPGGTLTLELPEDPDAAARVVSTVRAVLEAERVE